MVSSTVMIAANDDVCSSRIRALLQKNGYNVTAIVKSPEEFFFKVQRLNPNFIIIDSDVIQKDDIETLKYTNQNQISNVLLLIDEARKDSYAEYFSSENIVCITKPLTKQTLLITIDLINKYNGKIKILEQKVQELKTSLEARKEVEKAKGLLMKHYGISENDAFTRIQKQSMSKGVPVKEIAKAIILTYGVEK